MLSSFEAQAHWTRNNLNHRSFLYVANRYFSSLWKCNDEKVTNNVIFFWFQFKLLTGNIGKLTFPDPESPTRTIFSFLTTSSSSMSDIGKIGIKGVREEETRRDTKSFGLSCEKSCRPRRFYVDYNTTYKRRVWHVAREWNRANRPTGRGQCNVVVYIVAWIN